jgi:AraC-like DNA-binding protein
MNESILNGILIFGSIQAIFFSLLFATKQGREIPDSIIAIWLFSLAINILFIIFAKSVDNDYLKVFQVSFTLTHGAFLYLYARKLSTESAKFYKTDFLHFVPFSICIIFGVIAVYFKIHAQSIINVIAVGGVISGLSYIFVTIHDLFKHRNHIKDKFSYTEKINLNWLIHLSIGLFIIWIGGSLAGILLRFFQYNIPLVWLFVVIPMFIFYIGFYGIKQNIIYSNKKDSYNEIDNSSNIKLENSDKYKKSRLQEQFMETINNKLINAMEKEHLFLNPTLTLSELSKQIKTPSHHITQTLNEYIHKSFYDFVNYYRVEEFKRRVFESENKSFSLLGIAYDCGFNSKSSFNRIFKKHTGQSPSEYKKEYQRASTIG